MFISRLSIWVFDIFSMVIQTDVKRGIYIYIYAMVNVIISAVMHVSQLLWIISSQIG